MDIPGFLGVSGAIIGIATLAGLGLMRGTVTALRESLNDARGEIADKDRRLTEAEKKSLAQHVELEKQRIQIGVLQSTVTGEVHWQALGQTLREHHTEAQHHWRRDEELLEEINERLGGTSS